MCLAFVLKHGLNEVLMLSCRALYQLSHLPSSVLYFFCPPAYGTLMKRWKTVNTLCRLSFLTVEGSGDSLFTLCAPTLIPASQGLALSFALFPHNTFIVTHVPSTFEFLSCTREREDVLGVKGEPWKIPPRQGGRGNEGGGQERGIF